MLGLNETIYQLTTTNSVQWHGDVTREGRHVLRRALSIEVDGQRKEGWPKRT